MEEILVISRIQKCVHRILLFNYSEVYHLSLKKTLQISPLYVWTLKSSFYKIFGRKLVKVAVFQAVLGSLQPKIHLLKPQIFENGYCELKFRSVCSVDILHVEYLSLFLKNNTKQLLPYKMGTVQSLYFIFCCFGNWIFTFWALKIHIWYFPTLLSNQYVNRIWNWGQYFWIFVKKNLCNPYLVTDRFCQHKMILHDFTLFF